MQIGSEQGLPRVVVADDHVPTRLGVRMALEAGGFVVVREVGTGAEAVQAAVAERPEACLLDVLLPGGGIAAAEAISARAPATVVVVLTASARPDELIAAIRAGASGYLPKAIDGGPLVAALEGALSGEPAVPRALVAWLVDDIRARGGPRSTALVLRRRAVRLTPREAQVLELMREELPTREIAARLGISQVTVRRHVSQLLRKLDATDRKAVVALLDRRQRPGAPR